MTDAACHGTCTVCGQELILTADDCWHPYTITTPCPPEHDVNGVPTIEWGDGYGRPGRDKYQSNNTLGCASINR